MVFPDESVVLPEFLMYSMQYLCHDLVSCSQLEIPPTDVQLEMLHCYRTIQTSFPMHTSDDSLSEVIWQLIYHGKVAELQRFLMALSQFDESLEYIRATIETPLL